jgi:hypothetical protein
MLFPVATAARAFFYLFFRFSKSSKKISGFKGKFEGGRCFVIGNGPSLTIDDLNRLKGEVTFASNRIFDVFDKTDWRPTFYLSTDLDVIFENAERIRDLETEYKFVNLLSFFKGMRAKNGVVFVFGFGRYLIRKHKFVKKSHSGDVSKYVSISHTITAVAIEIAVYMGFREIILLGVDNSYSRTVDKDGVLREDGAVSDYRVTGEHSFKPAFLVDSTESCYAYFREFSEKNGIKIRNATRGGKLEVFERTDFDGLFESAGGSRK